MKFGLFTVVIGALAVFSGASALTTDDITVIKKLTDAINHFAVDLYKVLNTTENAVLSPLGVQTLAAMVYFGARESTAEEMRLVLGYENADLGDAVQVTQAFKKLLDYLSTLRKGNTLNLANRVIVDDMYTVRETYREVLQENFHTKVGEVDFSKTSDIMNSINSWVNETTKGKIGRILNRPLNRDTEVAFLNAAYFNGIWRYQFEKMAKSQPFYNYGVTEKSVKMIHAEASANYAVDEELSCKAVEVPYDSSPLSMLFILPDARDGLPALERKLNFDKLRRLIRSSEFVQNVDIKLPRFTIKKRHNLERMFKKVGLNKMFRSWADLSGIAPLLTFRSVPITIHKAKVEVKEKGSRLAERLRPGQSWSKKYNFVKFHVDHPFIFAVRDRNTGLILFIGRVNVL